VAALPCVSGYCLAGYYSVGLYACAQVPAGYYKPKASFSDSYYICGPGYYSLAGASACSACDSVTSYGATFCCPAGTYLSGSWCLAANAGGCNLDLQFILGNAVFLLGTSVSTSGASTTTSCSSSAFSGAANCQATAGKLRNVLFRLRCCFDVDSF
jgi:hypothetical protein